ncbi:amino acid permease [Paenibacillus sp. R14(2021)]|uniref:amino acid permease n=1 Tax=Paenibacillus sp. R14(2021) TaxID=2859228 RepID=UPI001C6159AE|nr:amino acid permease [Paenibacillus sp. R14(2021)]
MVLLWIGCLLFAAVCMLTLSLARIAEKRAKLSLHQSLHQHSAYVRFMQDKHELNALGFAQQLTRYLSGLASFGFSFSSLSLIGGAILFLGPALAAGGPALIGFGWPLLGLFGLLTACSIAALASSVPTAGGCYHWALSYGGRRLGLWSGWLHVIGSLLMSVTTNLLLADWMCRIIEDRVGYSGGSGLFYTLLVLLFVSQGLVGVQGIRGLGALFTAAAGLQLLLIVVLFAMLALAAWPGEYPFQTLSGDLFDSGTFGKGGHSLLLGILLLQRLFLGKGTTAHAAEETCDPRINVPWSIYLSTTALFMLGFVLFAFILMHTALGGNGSGAAMLGLGVWLTEQWSAWGPLCSILCFIIAVFICWANGLTAATAATRALFAMARDESVPYFGKIAFVSKQFRSPMYAVITVSGASYMLATLLCTVASPESIQPLVQPLILLSVAAVHAAYALPVGLKLRSRYSASRQGVARSVSRDRGLPNRRGPWELGKYSVLIDAVTFGWLTVSAMLACSMLALSVQVAAVILAGAGFVGIELRHRSLTRKTPVKVVGSSRFGKRTIDECIRIERKFPQNY